MNHSLTLHFLTGFLPLCQGSRVTLGASEGEGIAWRLLLLLMLLRLPSLLEGRSTQRQSLRQEGRKGFRVNPVPGSWLLCLGCLRSL